MILCMNIILLDVEDYSIASSKLTNKKTMVSWKIFVEKTINTFKNDRFDFSHISQMKNRPVTNILDSSF